MFLVPCGSPIVVVLAFFPICLLVLTSACQLKQGIKELANAFFLGEYVVLYKVGDAHGNCIDLLLSHSDYDQNGEVL